MAAVSPPASNHALSGSTLTGIANGDSENRTLHEKLGHVDGINSSSSAVDLAKDTTSAINGRPQKVSYPKSRLDIVDRFLDEPRKLRVAIIGGGLAGILSGCLLPAKVPGVELVIYEKNPDFVSLALEKKKRGLGRSMSRHLNTVAYQNRHGIGRNLVRERLSRYGDTVVKRTCEFDAGGKLTCTFQGFAVTFHRMFTSRLSLQRRTGATSLLTALKSEITGSRLPRSTTSMSSQSLIIESMRLPGMGKPGHCPSQM